MIFIELSFAHQDLEFAHSFQFVFAMIRITRGDLQGFLEFLRSLNGRRCNVWCDVSHVNEKMLQHFFQERYIAWACANVKALLDGLRGDSHMLNVAIEDDQVRLKIYKRWKLTKNVSYIQFLIMIGILPADFKYFTTVKAALRQRARVATEKELRLRQKS